MSTTQHPKTNANIGTSSANPLAYHKGYKWVKRTKKSLNAGDIARQRFEALVSEKLKGEWSDTTVWKAREHKPDHSGFGSLDYQADRETAKTISENYT